MKIDNKLCKCNCIIGKESKGENNIDFDSLVVRIEITETALQNSARLVINRHVTAKAWLTGYYITEYEQNGSDRAKYGEKLLQNLSKRLGKKYAFSTLKLYRQFYITYPQLKDEVGGFIMSSSIGQSLISQLQISDKISQSLISQSFDNEDHAEEISISDDSIKVDPNKLFNKGYS